MVRRFRKKPVIVEAKQCKTYQDTVEAARWVGYPTAVFRREDLSDVLYINTLEGALRVSPGDWIIKGVNGEFYPRKPDIFEKTYEPAEIELDGEVIPVEDKRFK